MMLDPAVKKKLLAKGGEIAARLEQLLNHKEVKLTDLPTPLKPSEDPELRLRRWLDQIDRAIKAWGTDRLGRCGVCGAALPDATLAEQPWLDWCSDHRPS
jgi:hypothetical protein